MEIRDIFLSSNGHQSLLSVHCRDSYRAVSFRLYLKESEPALLLLLTALLTLLLGLTLLLRLALLLLLGLTLLLLLRLALLLLNLARCHIILITAILFTSRAPHFMKR